MYVEVTRKLQLIMSIPRSYIFISVIDRTQSFENYNNLNNQSENTKMSPVRCHHPESLLVPNANFGGEFLYPKKKVNKNNCSILR